MHFCLLYKEDYPWDVRVEKIAKTLVKNGHNVTIVCRNLDQRKTIDSVDGIQIRRLPRLSWFPEVLRKLLNLPLWCSPIWLGILYAVARRHSTDAIIVRDLPLMYSGLIVGRLVKSRVIFDMAECYPEMYGSGSEKRSLGTRILKSPKAAALYEKRAALRADWVMVMIEESRERLIRLGISESKVSIVSNTPPLEKYSGKVAEHRGTQLRIVYVGFVTEIRGLDLLVRGVREYIDVTNDAVGIKVDIVGEGAARNSLKRLVGALGVKDQVTVHGWLGHEEVNSLVSAANVGALTYQVCGHWNHTIPNKIFDYMLAGLPVLATEVVPIARILRDTDCGLVCRDGDASEVAEKMVALRSADLRARLGRNGHRAVVKQYNWETDSRTLINIVEAR